MAISIINFRLRFPEFEDVTEYPDARIQIHIDDSICFLGANEKRWNGKYDICQAYLSAHLLSIATSSEAGDTSSKEGAISSKSAGGVSISRNAIVKDRSDGDNFLMTTVYGQQFLIIRNMTLIGVLVTGQ